ncbi:ChbG/HpnK family deacetylase [Crenobacter cavernae]|uniref:ChbG/HpnK family deacetylase n=1 Tax=Crenobacter cavernae TaxID=2290923 RepID=A0A345Y7M4_9NEIS|nr:ChbG/HpnK family deacetylase [Crenobacter cavernae]AXK39926.1 ChbG/HpnK family deacetylase [Crenobacter cavernae]
MSRAFTLCADDFAQSAAIGEAILDLLAARRLSATSVFSQAPQLAALPDVDAGLHFKLTHPLGDITRPLPYWLVASRLRRLPVKQLSDALFATLAEYRFPAGRPYLRAPDRLGHPGDSRAKAAILRAACSGFSRRVTDAGYPALMTQWLAAAPDGALLMCHPGGDDADDEIAGARRNEYRYLASARFAEDCERAGVTLRPFRSAI